LAEYAKKSFEKKNSEISRDMLHNLSPHNGENRHIRKHNIKSNNDISCIPYPYTKMYCFEERKLASTAASCSQVFSYKMYRSSCNE